METLCEHCRRECWIEDDRAGEQVACPWCDKVFVAKEPPERLMAFASIVDALLTEREAQAQESEASASQTNTETIPRSKSRRRRPKAARPRPWLRMAALGVLGTTVVLGGAVAANRWYASMERAASAESTSTYLVWEPDPALVDQLGSWKNFDHFEFCPPKSFTQLNVLSDPGWLPPGGHFAGLGFQGEKRDQAEIFCYVVTFPPLIPMRGGLDEALDRFYGWLNHHATVTDLSRGEAEVGVLNGRKCMRCSFFCRLRRRRTIRTEAREGVVYVMLDEGRHVSFYTLCDPKLQAEHNLMAASLLTWREQ